MPRYCIFHPWVWWWRKSRLNLYIRDGKLQCFKGLPQSHPWIKQAQWAPWRTLSPSKEDRQLLAYAAHFSVVFNSKKTSRIVCGILLFLNDRGYFFLIFFISYGSNTIELWEEPGKQFVTMALEQWFPWRGNMHLSTDNEVWGEATIWVVSLLCCPRHQILGYFKSSFYLAKLSQYSCLNIPLYLVYLNTDQAWSNRVCGS